MINFSDNENISNLIDLERVSLISTLDIQKNFNKQILIFVKKFMANVNFSVDTNPNDETFFYLNESTNTLNKSNSNINMLKDLLDYLSNLNSSDENFADLIKNYNNMFKQNMTSIYENTESIEKFVFKMTVTDFSDSSQIICEAISPVNVLPEQENTITDSKTEIILETSAEVTSEPENILVISETQKKVILPYNKNTVKNILENNSKKYSSVEDVIEKLYTKPISYYKISSIARFKEAYKLVKEREKGSRFKALSLAFELLGNYSLHPAIISACSSLDELDIYLACLEENALDDFHFFNIKYDVPLSISKLAKNNI